VPFLGRKDLLDTSLLRLGPIGQTENFLLSSDCAAASRVCTFIYAVIVTPIYNTMKRIDRRLTEAAIDGCARFWQIVAHVIVPSSRCRWTASSQCG
jgi:putative spermidine/putrescine transport system permease protein